MAEENRFRTREIRVKLSDEEYALIIQKSHEAEMSTSDAIRSLIVFGSINAKWLDEKSKIIMNKANENMDRCIDEINKIGVNLNQIAYCTNIVGDANDEVIREALIHTKEIQKVLLCCYEELRDMCDGYGSNT